MESVEDRETEPTKQKLRRSITLKILNAEDQTAFGPVRFSDSIFLVTMDDRFILSSCVDHLSGIQAAQMTDEDAQSTGAIKITLIPVEGGDIKNMHGVSGVKWMLVDPSCGFALRGARQLRHAFRGRPKEEIKVKDPSMRAHLQDVERQKRLQMDQSSLEHIVQVQEEDGDSSRACKVVHHLDEIALEQGWFRLSEREVPVHVPAYAESHRMAKTTRVLSLEHHAAKTNAFAVLSSHTSDPTVKPKRPKPKPKAAAAIKAENIMSSAGNRDRFRWTIQMLAEMRQRTVVYVRSKLSTCRGRLKVLKSNREKAAGMIKDVRNHIRSIKAHTRDDDHPGSQLLLERDSGLLSPSVKAAHRPRALHDWNQKVVKRVLNKRKSKVRRRVVIDRSKEGEKSTQKKKVQKISFPRKGLTPCQRHKALVDACEATTQVKLEVWSLLDKQDPGLNVFSSPQSIRRGQAAKMIQQAWRRAHGLTWRQMFRHADDVLRSQLKREHHEARLQKAALIAKALEVKRLEQERKQKYWDAGRSIKSGSRGFRPKKKISRRSKRRQRALHKVRFRA